jgi:predicted helicase
MSALHDLLKSVRLAAAFEREKSDLFRRTDRRFLRHEAIYRDLYGEVWNCAQWVALCRLRTTPILYC